jgi:phosphatidylserine/phosphatidylglycerophosphate/cardiolipin synthase-like enzyme
MGEPAQDHRLDSAETQVSRARMGSGQLQKSLIAFLLIFGAAKASKGAQAPAVEETHLYSPDTNLERSELEMLRTARQSIDIAMYSFTDRELAQELAELAQAGVKIRVYRDRREYEQETERGGFTTTAILLAAGIQVRVKGSKELMHLNYVLTVDMCSCVPHLLLTGTDGTTSAT